MTVIPGRPRRLVGSATLAATTLVMLASGGCRTVDVLTEDVRADPRPTVPRTTTADANPRVRIGIARKVVAEKAAPGTLIAHDATRCVVTEARFRETRVGDRITCSWHTAP